MQLKTITFIGIEELNQNNVYDICLSMIVKSCLTNALFLHMCVPLNMFIDVKFQ